MMKGRPILGVISGFLFGLFGALTLILFGAIPLHSDLLWILPLVGIVFGMVMAAWAPFGKGPATAAATQAPADAPIQDDLSTPDDTVVDANPPVEPPPE